MGNGFSLLEACCGPARTSDMFDPSNTGNRRNKLTPREIAVLLMNNQIGISVLIIVQILILCFWLSLSFVPGFALYDGSPGHAHPVSHLGWWVIIETLIVISGIAATYFRLSANHANTKLEMQVSSARTYLVFFIFMVCVGMVANAVHVALTLVEAVYCNSSFCRGFNVVDPANALLVAQPATISAFLLVFVVLLFFDIFCVQLMIVYRAVTYRTHLWYAVWGAKQVFDIEQGEDGNNDNDQEDHNNEQTPVAPTESLVQGVITPMMKAAMSLKNRSKKE